MQGEGSESHLPITYDGTFRLDKDKAREIGKQYFDRYTSNDPFPHISIDSFLQKEIAKRLYDEFPRENLQHDISLKAVWEAITNA